jgi:phospholipid/cholesterol/gamma-HCH transport system substrate-binding protein
MRRRILAQSNELAAVIGLAVLASFAAVYILHHERLRIPLVDPAPFTLKAEFSTAQAVVPGQGQTIRVAGVRVGDIGPTELRDGRAIVRMDLDPQYDHLVHTDATAFLRPKTGLKDMFVELNPGTKAAPVATENFTVPVASTLPDVNTDEILAGLDQDTRDYFLLMVNGAGRGLQRRGPDLRDVLSRFEPTFRDTALVQGELAKRRRALSRLVRSLNLVNTALAGRDGDLARLIKVASPVLETLAAERAGLTESIRELPGTLASTRTSLARVESLATVLRPAADNLRPVARALDRANASVAPFALEAAPILSTKIRPFVRDARPLVRSLLPAGIDLVKSDPPLTQSFTVLNTLFNLLAHNPRGREGPGVAGRDEGFMFFLAWVAHQSASLWSNVDAHGPLRSLTFGGTCQSLREMASTAPQLAELIALAGPLTDPTICG